MVDSSIRDILKAELAPKKSTEEEELERIALEELLADAAEQRRMAEREGVIAAYRLMKKEEELPSIRTSRPNEGFLHRVLKSTMGSNRIRSGKSEGNALTRSRKEHIRVESDEKKSNVKEVKDSSASERRTKKRKHDDSHSKRKEKKKRKRKEDRRKRRDE